MKNATKLPVKRIEDFDHPESDAKLVQQPGFWLGFICFAGLALFIAFVASVKLGLGDDPSWLFAGSFAVACFGGTGIIYLAAEKKRERGKVFELYLATISPELLKGVVASPEYSQETKDAVIKYLSAAHPGWSLT